VTDANRPTAAAPAECWHNRGADAALAALETTRSGGLAPEEACRRLDEYGPNSLPAPERPGVLQRLLLQFHNVLIYVLLGAAVVTALLGHLLDSAVIAGVVVINAVIGFVQEGKAEAALDAIRNMLSPRAQVLRAGHREVVPAEQLVPGDIVFLASGDRVPADLRLVEVRSLRIEEAALTGESVPVEKAVAPVAADALLGDRSCMAYAGTLVTYGQAAGVVTATGATTEIGRISAMLAEVTSLETPLTRQMATFGRWLTVAILALAAAAFAFGTLLRDYTASEMFLAAVGLAVAAIPEGLPAILTITLAIGVQQMARRRAIIRRLPAVETLGSVTVICSDKTGTLTRNEMTVQQLLMADATLAVGGVGYAPDGGFSLDGEEIAAGSGAGLTEVARAALLCNDATVRRGEDGHWSLTGDPTEGALVTLALKVGLDEDYEREAWPRTDAIPFESEHRFMATLNHDHDGNAVVFLKGAPERVLELCAVQRSEGGDAPLDAATWHQRMECAAAAGMRLLALASRRAPTETCQLTFAEVEAGGFTLLAVVGIADPPRPEAIEAVASCRAAGIRVKMITGDHVLTARAIGEQLGLEEQVRAVSGREIETLSDAELREQVADVAIFARASPEHKLRLVGALQARGEVVAMTGDGVNDAPALKQADVGVAMGQAGTEAAKEAAEMVLADDNFASIAAAVEEGRTVYDNIRKAIVFILPTNGGQAGLLVVAIVLGLTLPITPVQILWVNMVTAVTLALALAFEKAEADIMQRPPRDPREPLLTGFLVWRITFVSALLVAGSLTLFLRALEHGDTLEAARTVAINALVMGEIVYLFNVRQMYATILNRDGLLGNPYALLAVGVLVVLQGLFIYLPAMQAVFHTAPLGPQDWRDIAGFGVVVLLVVEAEKWIVRRYLARRGAATLNGRQSRDPGR
jgi:magnesium-transporting ATPase (P-type)